MSQNRTDGDLPSDMAHLRLVKESAVAQLLGMSQATVERMRKAGTGPKCLKIGPRRIGYRLDDVKKWLEERGGCTTPVEFTPAKVNDMAEQMKATVSAAVEPKGSPVDATKHAEDVHAAFCDGWDYGWLATAYNAGHARSNPDRDWRKSRALASLRAEQEPPATPEPPFPTSWYDAAPYHCEISTRLRNLLEKNFGPFITLGQLDTMLEQAPFQIIKIEGMGGTSFNELKEYIADAKAGRIVWTPDGWS